MTITEAVPETTTTMLSDTAANLLLARLLVPGKRPPSPSRVRADLNKFFQQPLSTEQFQELVDQLRAADLLAEKGMVLTDQGRKRALEFLGTDSLPAKCNWGTIQNKYLVPRALGLDPNSEDDRKTINRQEKLAALLLKRRFNLPAGTGNGLRDVMEALACQELGFPEETKLENVENLVLSQMLGAPERLDQKKLNEQLPRVLLGATRSGLGGLREVLLRTLGGDASNLATALPPPEQAEEPAVVVVVEETVVVPAEFDLLAFANTVKAVARHCPAGHFGDNKVFINHVWRQLAPEPGFAGMDLDTFKQKLVEANRENLLTLSRADLVSVMDPEDVSESETHYLNAVFHFILIEKEQP